jgi:hypothetical protein
MAKKAYRTATEVKRSAARCITVQVLTNDLKPGDAMLKLT